MKTCEELTIQPRNRYNLIKIGLWLHANAEKLSPHFRMAHFSQNAEGINCEIADAILKGVYQEPNECGTSCCIIGHSLNPSIGLRYDSREPLEDLKHGTWGMLGRNLYGLGMKGMWGGCSAHNTEEERKVLEDTQTNRLTAWDFLFSGGHADDPVAASKRIFWFLEKGFQGLAKDKAATYPTHWDPERMEVHASTVINIETGARGPVLESLIMDKEGTWSMDIPMWEAELKKAEEEMNEYENM